MRCPVFSLLRIMLIWISRGSAPSRTMSGPPRDIFGPIITGMLRGALVCKMQVI